MTKVPMQTLVERITEEVPEFADALRKEREHLAFCKEVRTSLQRMRSESHLNQSEIAERMETTQPAVSKIENGDGDIGLMTLSRYAAALGMRVSVSLCPAATFPAATDSPVSLAEGAIKVYNVSMPGSRVKRETELLAESKAWTTDPSKYFAMSDVSAFNFLLDRAVHQIIESPEEGAFWKDILSSTEVQKRPRSGVETEFASGKTVEESEEEDTLHVFATRLADAFVDFPEVKVVPVRSAPAEKLRSAHVENS